MSEKVLPAFEFKPKINEEQAIVWGGVYIYSNSKFKERGPKDSVEIFGVNKARRIRDQKDGWYLTGKEENTLKTVEYRYLFISDRTDMQEIDVHEDIYQILQIVL